MSEAFVFTSGAENDDPLSIEDVKPVVACRGCLYTEQPLRPLDHKLADAFRLLISPISQSEIFPDFLCGFCCALLKKFEAFRRNCLDIQSKYFEIYSSGVQITQDVIHTNIKPCPYPELKKTILKSIDLGDNTEPTGSYKSFTNIDIPENKITFKNENSCSKLSKTPVNTNDSELESNISETPIQIGKDTTEGINLGTRYLPTDLKTDLSDSEIGNINITDINNDEVLDNLPLNNFITQNDANKALTNGKIEEKSRKKSKRKDSQKKTKDWPLHHKKSKRILNNKTGRVSKDPIKSKTTRESTESIQKVIKSNIKTQLKGQKLDAEKIYNAKVLQLSKEDQINQIQSRKESLNYKRSKYKCVQCFRGFITELTYKNHMVRHEPNQGEHVCDVCFMRYETPKKLNEHCNNQHRYNFVCNYCGVITKSNCNAKLHYDWHQGVKYDCKVCGKSFDKPTSVTGHMHLSHGGNVTCSICNETFIGHKGLSTHMIKAHKEAIGAVCACGVQFHSFDALRRHRPQGVCEHTLRPCTVCGEGFQTEEQLKKHKLDAHKSGFTCDQCDKTFDSMLKYRCHFAVHNEDHRPTNGRRGRRRNMADANKLKPVFMCEICGSNLTTKTSLEIHIRTHTGEKPFQCDHCDRRFNAKSILHLHMTKHLNLPAKEFGCSFCGKQFNLPQNRDRHENGVHRKLRRFKCDICDKMYSEKVNLQAHIKTKHLGMPWPKRVRPPRRRAQKTN